MKKWGIVGIFFLASVTFFSQAFAVLEFPSSLLRDNSYEGGTVAPANTSSTFFQNLLQKVNFGNIFTPQPAQTQNQNTQAQQTTNNTNSYVPDNSAMQNYDAEYQKILKQNLGGGASEGNTGSTYSSSIIQTNNQSIQNILNSNANNSKYLTQDDINKKLENFILQVNKIRSGYSTPVATPTNIISQNNTQSNNLTPQQQQQIQSNLNQNSMPAGNFSSCSFANSPQAQQSCLQSMKLTCQQGYLGGELLMPECSQLPVSTYAGMQYGSQPTYSLNNYVNHDPYYTSAAQTIGVNQASFPGNYFNKEGNYVGPDRSIIGNATHYACTKNKSGQYVPDNYLISTYSYITAFGYKARYGTNVGDSTNACNFNYCGVAVPLQFLTATYGSKAAGKNQLIQIVNTENLKCTVAPIQDISAVKTFTHAGSNAVIDLSLCVMEKISNKGSARVQYRPLRKGEVGCNQSMAK